MKSRGPDTGILPKIAVVIPCYRAAEHVLDVIAGIGPEVFVIIAVDDHCPERTGKHIEEHCKDERALVEYLDANCGVGAAVMHGYHIALALGADVIVKIDSDGQMDPRLLLRIVNPISTGHADYAKGNRFFNLEDLQTMPWIRLIGNAGLSFLTKLSSGYWNIFDPTNGYTAIHRTALELLPLQKIEQRFFFESDMLFRLNLIGAVVADVPIPATYGSERSNLRIGSALPSFFFKNLRNFVKRVLYRYYLRDFNFGSLELAVGIFLLTFGSVFGGYHWLRSMHTGVLASAGVVMIASLPILVGIQMIIGFFAIDIMATPKAPLHRIMLEIGDAQEKR